jgi:SET domain-containing protein
VRAVSDDLPVKTNAISVRRSPVHGRGAFAKIDVPPEHTLLDYQGKRITWAQACADYEAHGVEGHTFYFDIGNDLVIDGGSSGNAARWINHSCDPNCETVNEDDQIKIRTLRAVSTGEEFTIDYNLVVDDPADPEQRAVYGCACGSPKCRGTMLAG